MDDRSLTALLSQTLIAYTIEFDNQFEAEVPHRISLGESSPSKKPYLVSLAMWANFLSLVDEDGITVAEFRHRTGFTAAQASQWITRMTKWWGYLTVAHASHDAVIAWTEGGLRARRTWVGLHDRIENRWRERFGSARITRLRDALSPFFAGERLTAYLPVAGYGLMTGPIQRRSISEGTPAITMLLSNVLLAFAVEAEKQSDIAFAVYANVVRLLSEEPERVSELPRRSGLSNEAIAMALSFLEKREYCARSSENRSKVVRLTDKGRRASVAYDANVASIEDRWRERYGIRALLDLRDASSSIVDDERFVEAIASTTAGWRTTPPYQSQTLIFCRDPAKLPRYPAVLHRGGWPDGS